MHAEDMIENEYMGHWWVDGRKPYMVYSETGGSSYVAENVAASGWTQREWSAKNCGAWTVNCLVPTVKDAITEAQYGMMYDDAHASWGHRDNILRETHRAVSLGIASNGRRIIFVQHFEGGDAVAPKPPVLSSDGRLTFTVSKVAGGIDIGPVVTVSYDPPPTPKTPEQIDRTKSYCVGGGFRETCLDAAAVRILKPPPSGSYYPSLDNNEVVADEWSETPTEFRFSADLGSLADAPGIYTVSIWRAGSGLLLTDVLVELSVQPDGLVGKEG